ncbi:hypothetical protein D1007_23388 [Hordeum vulgare]|nr:hypothetical protein D1007_23388 [Hordeum vulgare]
MFGLLGPYLQLLPLRPLSTDAEMTAMPAVLSEGSMITEAHIDYLRRTRRIPLEERVETRVSGNERVPEPQDDERVVFGTHFPVSFGLPASRFMRQFLDFYELHMHHLGPNSVLYLAYFAMLCERFSAGSWRRTVRTRKSLCQTERTLTPTIMIGAGTNLPKAKEDEVEALTGAAAGGARPSGECCRDVTLKDWTDNDDDDDVCIVDVPPTTAEPPRRRR